MSSGKEREGDKKPRECVVKKERIAAAANDCDGMQAGRRGTAEAFEETGDVGFGREAVGPKSNGPSALPGGQAPGPAPFKHDCRNLHSQPGVRARTVLLLGNCWQSHSWLLITAWRRSCLAAGQ
jgi:hypothetical protein